MPRLALLLIAALAAGAAQAATYKWVDANGQVNYGDRPPDASVRPLGTAAPRAQEAVQGDATLPYPLRMASARYPVTLFTGRDCEPCEQARGHLARRGIPYAERQLRTEHDIESFRKLGFAEALVPSVQVGRETAAGYRAEAWDRLFDAAGYPRTSLLPSRWRAAPPQALVEASAAPGTSPGRLPMTTEWLNDPANQRDDLREGLVSPEAKPVPILEAPLTRPAARSNIRF